MTERHDIWKLSDAIQMDLRNAQAKMIALRSYLASLNLETQPDRRTPANMQAPYVPGQLRYLEQARRVWARYQGSDDLERDMTVRVYLEGFTGDQHEIAAHLTALEQEAP